MATLEKIRKKGVLLALIVGIALMAFIFGGLLKSGNSLFSKKQFEIAEIAGKSINIQEYQQKVEYLMEIYKINTNQDAIDAATAEGIRQQTWNELIQEYVLNTEYEDLGLAVCSDEIFDLVQGRDPHPIIRQMFTNETGQLDNAGLMNFLKNMNQDPYGTQKAFWLYIENQIKVDRALTKYTNLIKKGLFITSKQAEQEYYNTNKKVDFSYIVQRFNTIPDSNIVINNSDITKYYNNHLNDFTQSASRDIEYITFDVIASDEDNSSAENWINNITEEFKATSEVIQFVNLNSDIAYNPTNYKDGDLSEVINDFMFNAEIGDVYGPYFEDETYKLARLSEINYLPDSVKARHILLQPAAQTQEDYNSTLALADSLKILIENGTDFGLMAMIHSKDGSAQSGGDLGWFAEGAMVQPFSDSCFFGEIGDLPIVETQFGIHIIEIQDKGKYVKKVQVASLERKVEPSSKTYQNYYSTANQFAGRNNSRDKFENAVSDEGLTKRIANNILENDQRVAGLESPRQLIRWAFSADKDDISPIFEFGNRFVIAMLTEVREEGPATLDQVRIEVELNVKKEKKAQQLAEQLSAELELSQDLSELALKLNTSVEEATNISFSSFSVPGAGIEPKVISTAVNIEQGVLSKPIAGVNGVYIILVNNIIGVEEADYIAEKAQLINNLQARANYEAYEALKVIAKIKDKRSKFY